MPGSSFYSVLAASMIAGDPAEDAMVLRMSHTLGRNWRWARPLARRYRSRFGFAIVPRKREVVSFLRADDGLRDAMCKYGHQVRIVRWLHEVNRMRPVPAARTWPIPAIESTAKLAAWLGLSVGHLQWFANIKGLDRRRGQIGGPLAHYNYRVLEKAGGAIRLIEAPKRTLKELQRRILGGILEKIPVHPAVHGFRKGRSIKTFAGPHVAQRIVLRMDLQDFFPSLGRARVQAFFRTAGYPEPVADLLGALCTNTAPQSLWKNCGHARSPERISEAGQLYGKPHLPQGAPTSPALANLCAYRVDCRLAGLAHAAGAIYTRYADDLAFSGNAEFDRSADRFALHAAAILLEEGFTVHHRKTRIMRQGVRQHLAGVVTNQHLNVMRADFDRLKATLTNCIRHGPVSQNRERHLSFESHLDGRVGFIEMINAARGAKLRRLFEQIVWDQRPGNEPPPGES